MSYILDSTTLRAPNEIQETNSTQHSEQRALDGTIGRDYFGDNKRVWQLSYRNVNQTDYNTIKTIYDSYLNTGSTKTWESTESNYTISETNVHVDLEVRQFRVKGSDYLSDFVLTLTEA